MKRVTIALGVLGLMVAASTAQAAVPKEVTLFGQKYTLTEQQLATK